MIDNFDLLNEQRRPWLDIDGLKQKFLRFSAAVHPDKVHGASDAEKESANKRYAEINAAYNCLREPKERLLHLLELEAGSKPKDVQRIPPGTMDLFVEVGQLCRDVDQFLTERSTTESPLLKVQLFERGMEWAEKLTALQGRLNAKVAELEKELHRLNAIWETAPSVERQERLSVLPLSDLENLYRIHSYIARWSAQIRER